MPSSAPISRNDFPCSARTEAAVLRSAERASYSAREIIPFARRASVRRRPCSGLSIKRVMDDISLGVISSRLISVSFRYQYKGDWILPSYSTFCPVAACLAFASSVEQWARNSGVLT